MPLIRNILEENHKKIGKTFEFCGCSHGESNIATQLRTSSATIWTSNYPTARPCLASTTVHLSAAVRHLGRIRGQTSIFMQGKALAVSSGICIAAGLAGVVIMQQLEIQQRQLARVSVPEALGLVQDQQVCEI